MPTPEPEGNEPRRMYTNYFKLEAGLYDFSFKFGIRDQTQAERNAYSPQVELFMSPEHAKSLLIILQRNIEIWESRFAPLPVTEDMFAREPQAQGDPEDVGEH